MKIIKSLFLLLISCCIFAACSSGNDASDASNQDAPVVENVVTSAAAPEHTFVTFETQSHGKFVVETYPEHAPETVRHFLELVDGGFYNSFTIEQIRHSEALVTSESSPALRSDSAAALATTVSGEFTKNGRSNALKLEKYTLALNHIPTQYDSGSAQFMIMLTSSHDFDGEYAGFGKVVQGTEVIDKIAGSEVDRKGTPVSPIVMKKVYINE